LACLAVHDRQAEDAAFIASLDWIKQASDDDRNFVRKAVNWALRQIGKRNLALNAAAIQAAREIRETGTKAGRWIAADALRELTAEPTQARLRRATHVKKNRKPL
jgi:3-methyladenine DNA glycosylase AlkD